MIGVEEILRSDKWRNTGEVFVQGYCLKPSIFK